VKPPNLLLLITDQQRYPCHWPEISGWLRDLTPNQHELAETGLTFHRAFTNTSMCSPSRATLLTGQYSHLNGVPVFNSFDGACDNFAKHLQAGGYHTGIIGKWHLGSDPTGFDRWIVLPGQGAYWNPVFLVAGRKLREALPHHAQHQLLHFALRPQREGA